jgi:protein-disulfide isomerase
MDFTCPYCAQLASVLDSTMSDFPETVAVEFHYFPLSARGNSGLSAVVAECAAAQGRFPEMYRALLAQTDSLDLKSWMAFAREVGVALEERFAACISRPVDSFPRILADKALGQRVGVRGTPAVWINGRVSLDRDRSAFFRTIRDLTQEPGLAMRK